MRFTSDKEIYTVCILYTIYILYYSKCKFEKTYYEPSKMVDNKSWFIQVVSFEVFVNVYILLIYNSIVS